MFVNNSGHDVVIKPSEYEEKQPPSNIIVPNGETYYGSIDGFWDKDRGWYKVKDGSSVKLTENKIDLLGAGDIYDYLAKKDWWPKFLKDKPGWKGKDFHPDPGWDQPVTKEDEKNDPTKKSNVRPVRPDELSSSEVFDPKSS